MSVQENSTLVLSSCEVADVVRRLGFHPFMDQLIERMQIAFEGYDPSATVVPPRDGFRYQIPVPGLVEWMPLHQVGQTVMMKMVGYHPENPGARQVPTVLANLNLFDTQTGRLKVICDARLLTAMRTGAASAVASRLLSAEDSTELGLIGCGTQAVTQLHGVSRIRNLSTIRYFDISDDVMRSFAARTQYLLPQGVRLVPSTLRDVVEQSQILCTATSIKPGEGPLFDSHVSLSAVHVNAVGSDLPGKTELPMGLLHDALVIPDFRDQAIVEGECQQLTSSQIGPSMMDVAASPEQWVDHRMSRTVFDSTGWALEDFVALELLTEHARDLSIGSRVVMSADTLDPWNPYLGLNADSERLRSCSVAGGGSTLYQQYEIEHG